MPRAKRYHVSGYVWHLTHRCHKREFLLKFARDRRRWCHWLFEAQKRYGLSVLDYIVTSNHIHLLVHDTGSLQTISRSMQLIAGRTGQEFNQRKGRKGAFWEDRYHATAVESGKHLIECIVYIDMNMVRAGVIQHPREWECSGYNEIQNPRQRYRLIDQERLYADVGASNREGFIERHSTWIEEAVRAENSKRESRWSQSVGVGGKGFIERLKVKLGYLAIGRKSIGDEGAFELREKVASYDSNIAPENDAVRAQNRYVLNDIVKFPRA